MNNSLLNSNYQKKLLKKWAPILECKDAPAIDSMSKKVTLAQILENTRNYYGPALNEGMEQADAVGSKGSAFGKDGVAGRGVMTGTDSYPYRAGEYGDFYLPNVVMPMLRRIMPDLLANELVAVQPLNGPVGFALAFRPTYGEDGGSIGGQTPYDLTAANEIGYNPTDTRWTGITADMPAGADAEYLSAYCNDARWFGEGAKLGVSEYARLGQNYPTVTFGLVKSTVEARTRKLAAHWSPELQEDMAAMHGIDVEKEMVNTLTYEVGAEIDRQIVSEMVKAAIVGGSTSKWSPISADGLDQMGRLATLLTQITMEAYQISIRTKRGNANFAITTPRVCALLAQMGMNKYTSFKANANMPAVPDTGVGALAKVGLINDDSMLLIRDAHVQAADSDYVLMGYKGKQTGDSGIIYAPYIPLQLQRVLQPRSFTMSVGARTRYGLMANPFDASQYYAFIKVENCTSEYTWNGARHFVGETSPIQLKKWNGGSPVMPMA